MPQQGISLGEHRPRGSRSFQAARERNDMERIQIGGVSIELLTAGDGPPLLFLHGGDYFARHREFFDTLARDWRLVVPRHPGFGNSERPDGFRTVHDLAYLYLDLLERQDFGRVTLAGSSFGGWIAL